MQTSEELHRTSDTDLAEAVHKLREQADGVPPDRRHVHDGVRPGDGPGTRGAARLHGRRVQGQLLRDLAAGRLQEEELFDENYRQVEGGRFASRASDYFKAEVLPQLAGWKAAHGSLIYVVVMDRNGFMPAHLMPARTGVIMKDAVSLQGARSKTLLSQTFRRPVEAGGELVVDIATPIDDRRAALGLPQIRLPAQGRGLSRG